MSFGEKVSKARAQAGLSQKSLANMTEVSLRTVQNYENGVSRPKKLESIYRLADVLRVTPQSLMDDDLPVQYRNDEDYMIRGKLQSKKLTKDVCTLLNSGEISEEDMDGMMAEIMDAYWNARENIRKKRRGRGI